MPLLALPYERAYVWRVEVRLVVHVLRVVSCTCAHATSTYQRRRDDLTN